ncbi:MAG: hypothetical protein COV45_03520 [Deltaproteobacteria bacterium CG11_big_fil_rev_8_21_14_0_20_47_16]|nr:MAG: hypothetical protein COV45_03520 [Deltaproteobacteria bacterium CG11_big_fil_rev_8_21_14_0_20_47_16]
MCLSACATSGGAGPGFKAAGNKQYPDIFVPSGTSSPSLNMGFEVAYDSRLDNIIPGYKILTVAITNNSLEYLQMDPLADKWWVVDSNKGRHRAILMMRDENPKVWAKLPQRLRQMIEYPLMVRIAESTTIDLMFPDSVNLETFREAIFQSSSKKYTIHIVPRE